MPTLSTPIFLAAGLLLGLAGLLWGRRARRSAFVEVAPHWRVFLRRNGLTEIRHFLDLTAVVVSGHPDRSVARATLTDGALTINVFLKREYRISWAVRLSGWAAGFGFVSRSLREARILEALGGEGVGCPEWLAAGEDGRGRAFLLVRETSGATDLRAWLSRETGPGARLRLARRWARPWPGCTRRDSAHPDLYSKHVLVGSDGDIVQFLDWQRSRRRRLVVDARAAPAIWRRCTPPWPTTWSGRGSGWRASARTWPDGRADAACCGEFSSTLGGCWAAATSGRSGSRRWTAAFRNGRRWKAERLCVTPALAIAVWPDDRRSGWPWTASPSRRSRR